MEDVRVCVGCAVVGWFVPEDVAVVDESTGDVTGAREVRAFVVIA